MLDWLTLTQSAFNRGDDPLLYRVLMNFDLAFVVMRFTGLTDRHGKQMYEGDIVRLNGRGDSRSVVRWIDGAFRVEQSDFRDAMHFLPHEAWVELFVEQHCEVIGDVFRNPDLLPAP